MMHKLTHHKVGGRRRRGTRKVRRARRSRRTARRSQSRQ